MIKISKKLLALSLAGAVMVSSISVGVSAEDKFEDPWLDPFISYTFDNANAGYASGTISVTGSKAERLTLYWADINGNRLKRDGINYSKLADMTVSEGSAQYKIQNSYTAIPSGAKKLIAVDQNNKTELSYTIPNNKLFNKGTKSYSFGVMSDIHYNRYTAADGKTDIAVQAFAKGMTFMEKTAKVLFASATGDLSSRAEESAYQKYAAEVKKHSIPMFTVMGNHDATLSTNYLENRYWKKYINLGINSKTAKSKGILQVADNGIDFVYQNPNKKNEVYIFLSQKFWRGQNSDKNLMNPEDMNWLEEMLATYSNKNVFLYFHTYLSDNSGDITNCVGNLEAPNGYSYDLTYPYNTSEEKRYKSLLRKYSNVTVFSGHSHWMYETQEFNKNLNIGSLGSGATLVHVSSITEPRQVSYSSDETRIGMDGLASEAMVVDVYSNGFVYNGVDVYNNEYLSYATYMSEAGKKTTPVKIIVPNKVKVTKAIKANKKAKKATVTWNKVKNAIGYQIQYSTSPSFKASVTKTQKVKKNTVTIKGLKPGKTYYVRVCGYSKAYGRLRFGKYGVKKKVTVKVAKKTTKKK